jgi:hypothetical protein
MRYFDIIESCQANALFSREFHIEDTQIQRHGQIGCIIDQVGIKILARCICIVKSGKMLTGKFQRAMLFTIKTVIRLITQWITLNAGYYFGILLNTLKITNMIPITCPEFGRLLFPGIDLQREESGIRSMGVKRGKKESPKLKNATTVGKDLKILADYQAVGFALTTANLHGAEQAEKITRQENVSSVISHSSEINIKSDDAVLENVVGFLGVKYQGKAPVYNLFVDTIHEYYANGILVSNCDALRYLCMGLDMALKPSIIII